MIATDLSVPPQIAALEQLNLPSASALAWQFADASAPRYTPKPGEVVVQHGYKRPVFIGLNVGDNLPPLEISPADSLGNLILREVLSQLSLDQGKVSLEKSPTGEIILYVNDIHITKITLYGGMNAKYPNGPEELPEAFLRDVQAIANAAAEDTTQNPNTIVLWVGGVGDNTLVTGPDGSARMSTLVSKDIAQVRGDEAAAFTRGVFSTEMFQSGKCAVFKLNPIQLPRVFLENPGPLAVGDGQFRAVILAEGERTKSAPDTLFHPPKEAKPLYVEITPYSVFDHATAGSTTGSALGSGVEFKVGKNAHSTLAEVFFYGGSRENPNSNKPGNLISGFGVGATNIAGSPFGAGVIYRHGQEVTPQGGFATADISNNGLQINPYAQVEATVGGVLEGVARVSYGPGTEKVQDPLTKVITSRRKGLFSWSLQVGLNLLESSKKLFGGNH